MKKYTEYEDTFIRNNYEKMSSREIAEHLGRTKGSVDRYIQRNGIKKPISSGHIWSSDEEKFMIDNYKKMSNIEISNFTCWKLSIRKQSDVKMFLDYIYKDSNIYLDRKYLKYLSSNCLKLQ